VTYPLAFGALLGVTQYKFHKDLWQQKTRVHVALFAWFYVVTDRHTDTCTEGHHIANTVLHSNNQYYNTLYFSN